MKMSIRKTLNRDKCSLLYYSTSQATIAIRISPSTNRILFKLISVEYTECVSVRRTTENKETDKSD